MLSPDTLALPAVAKMMDIAERVLGYDLGKLIREGERQGREGEGRGPLGGVSREGSPSKHGAAG
jgi:hypothetical protein